MPAVPGSLPHNPELTVSVQPVTAPVVGAEIVAK